MFANPDCARPDIVDQYPPAPPPHLELLLMVEGTTVDPQPPPPPKYLINDGPICTV